MIQCQEIIFEGFPGTPLFLPDISQKLVYLSLPFLMDQKAADLLCQIFHLALFLTAQDPGTALCQCFGIAESLPCTGKCLFVHRLLKSSLPWRITDDPQFFAKLSHQLFQLPFCTDGRYLRKIKSASDLLILRHQSAPELHQRECF